jgi:hypothetical protein
LIELLIVVSVLGFLMTVLAAAFVVVIRTVPDTEERVDDSRSLLGLTNWLSQDVMSASARDGIKIDDASPSRCAPASVPAGAVSLVKLSWADSGTRFNSEYWWVEQSATTGAIFRYSCLDGGDPTAMRVTTNLEKYTTGSPTPQFAPAPVDITEKPFVLPDGTPGIEGLEFKVYVYEGGTTRELLSLDAATSNIEGVLPTASTLPNSSTTTSPPTSTSPTTLPNLAPVGVGPLEVTSNIHYGQPGYTPTLYTLTGIYDPEGAPLTFNFATTNQWVVSVSSAPDPVSGYYVATIDSPPMGSSEGDPGVHGTWVFDYTVSDGTNTVTSQLTATFSHSATTTTTLAPPPLSTTTTLAVPPTALPASTNAMKGQPVVVSLADKVSDPNGGPLTLSFPSVPSGWTVTAAGTDVTIVPPATAPQSQVITYRVTDPGGLYAESTITVNVCAVLTVSVSPNQVSVLADFHLEQAVQVSITTNGACTGLVATYEPKVGEGEKFKAFGTGNAVLILTTDHLWDKENRNVTVNVRQSVTGAVERSTTFQTKKN